jgi:hypothetical protein
MTKPTQTKEQIKIQELIGDDEQIMFYDGLDKAIIGTAQRINLGPVVAYDVEKVIEIFMDRDGMTYSEAMEYFEFNTIGGFNGELTPVFIYKIEQEKQDGKEDNK